MGEGLTPLLWCIDVEPDPRIIDGRRPALWKGYEASVALFGELRPWIARLTGQLPHFSWYYRLDPQIAECHGRGSWPLTHYAAELEELLACHDEVGVHPHAYRFDVALGTWVIDYADQFWVDRCVQLCFDSFREVLGHGPASFRFGDAWLNEATLRLVEKLGARYDLTLEPGMTQRPSLSPQEHWTGRYPDHTQIPSMPYWPSKDDYRRSDPAGRDGILMLPITTTHRSGVMNLAYQVAFRAVKRCAPQPVTRLNVAAPGFLFRHLADQILARPGLPYLGISMRTHTANSPHAARRMRQNLTYLFTHEQAPRFAVMRPDEVAATLALDG
jgi:hypothetical protein